MWAGAKVHDCIERTLTNLQRGISVLDVDQIVDITLNQMREKFRSSVDPDHVELIEYNLSANQGAEFTVGTSEIENTKTYIAGSIS